MGSRVLIDIDSNGFGTLIVDGVDWSKKAKRVVLTLVAGDPPKVEVTLVPSALSAMVEEARMRGLVEEMDEMEEPDGQAGEGGEAR